MKQSRAIEGKHSQLNLTQVRTLSRSASLGVISEKPSTWNSKGEGNGHTPTGSDIKTQYIAEGEKRATVHYADNETSKLLRKCKLRCVHSVTGKMSSAGSVAG